MDIPPIRCLPQNSAHRRVGGFTLAEVMIATMVWAMVMLGVLSTLLATRRLTEGSIAQNSTVTIVQGYLEQIKNMPFKELDVSPAAEPTENLTVKTERDQNTPDPLSLSWGRPPATLPAAGAVPAGGVTNVEIFDINNTPANPHDNLELKLWVWINDLTGLAPHVREAKSITIIYSWKTKDGARERVSVGSVRTIRSQIPTF